MIASGRLENTEDNDARAVGGGAGDVDGCGGGIADAERLAGDEAGDAGDLPVVDDDAGRASEAGFGNVPEPVEFEHVGAIEGGEAVVPDADGDERGHAVGVVVVVVERLRPGPGCSELNAAGEAAVGACL